MINLSEDEMICFARVLSVFIEGLSPADVSNHEIELAIEAMKKMADYRYDWSHEQKDIYKTLADFVKGLSKQEIYKGAVLRRMTSTY